MHTAQNLWRGQSVCSSVNQFCLSSVSSSVVFWVCACCPVFLSFCVCVVCMSPFLPALIIPVWKESVWKVLLVLSCSEKEGRYDDLHSYQTVVTDIVTRLRIKNSPKNVRRRCSETLSEHQIWKLGWAWNPCMSYCIGVVHPRWSDCHAMLQAKRWAAGLRFAGNPSDLHRETWDQRGDLSGLLAPHRASLLQGEMAVWGVILVRICLCHA